MDTRKAEAAINVTHALMALDGEYRAVGALVRHEQLAGDDAIHIGWLGGGVIAVDIHQGAHFLQKAKAAYHG